MQVGDAIWAEFNESENHILPYPNGAKDSMLVSVGDHKNNDKEAASIAGIAGQSAGGQTELRGMEKQHANPTSAHFSATRLDIESWPDLPSLNPALDRNYRDDNIGSTYLDFSAEPSLHKVTGNTAVQLDGKCEVFGNDHEEKSSSFLDCDWGNIGDFDDFDRLFSSNDSMFGNEMVTNGREFLSSLDLMDNAAQSVPIPQVPLSKQPSAEHGPSFLLVNEVSRGISKQESKVADANSKSGEQVECKNHLTCEYSGKSYQFSQEGDAQKRLRSRRKQEERGKSKISSDTSSFSQSKVHNPLASLQSPMQPVQTQYSQVHDSKNMGQVHHPNQLNFPGYGYPAYLFPTIPLASSIQAEDHQTKLSATSYQTSADSPKHSSSIDKSQDIEVRPLRMTPQEKIKKLRRRQHMQALIAIQQQQQQFGQEGSGSDTIVPQAYSLRNKNPDSFGSSIVIDETTNNVFSHKIIPTSLEEVHKNAAISDFPFIEENIYYQLQDALGKLDTKTRLCIRDSLLRLAHSATERQVTGDRSSTNKATEDEDVTSEHDTFTRRTRSITKEAETTTNPIDRIVAHLLFHKHCSKVATETKETILSTRLTLEPESKLPLEIPRVPSEDQQNKHEMVLQPSQ
ncbi:hypothetical protein HU200_065722 [Digitaria exilis]|uniref:Protein LNK2 n=1 Tax=Digitaria exilis TaxID=1010633 RepID=A0A834ZY58_9POAL|nr:hypothetical protein HU200_065722 [Digitaria exilis]